MSNNTYHEVIERSCANRRMIYDTLYEMMEGFDKEFGYFRLGEIREKIADDKAGKYQDIIKGTVLTPAVVLSIISREAEIEYQNNYAPRMKHGVVGNPLIRMFRHLLSIAGTAVERTGYDFRNPEEIHARDISFKEFAINEDSGVILSNLFSMLSGAMFLKAHAIQHYDNTLASSLRSLSLAESDNKDSAYLQILEFRFRKFLFGLMETMTNTVSGQLNIRTRIGQERLAAIFIDHFNQLDPETLKDDTALLSEIFGPLAMAVSVSPSEAVALHIIDLAVARLMPMLAIFVATVDPYYSGLLKNRTIEALFIGLVANFDSPEQYPQCGIGLALFQDMAGYNRDALGAFLLENINELSDGWKSDIYMEARDMLDNIRFNKA